MTRSALDGRAEGLTIPGRVMHRLVSPVGVRRRAARRAQGPAQLQEAQSPRQGPSTWASALARSEGFEPPTF